MKALSVKQPYATLICTPREDNPLLGIKDIENRTTRTHFRGKIYIHASGKYANKNTGYKDISATDLLSCNQIYFVPNQLKSDLRNETAPISAIIGEVEIIDCVQEHPSIWAEKHNDIMGEFIHKPIWNWVLANPVLYDKPILNVKGKLSFWYPDNDIVECIGCSQKFDAEFMQEDDAQEKYCSECWEILAPVIQQEYEELKANGEID